MRPKESAAELSLIGGLHVQKGEKILMDIRSGEPIPPGIILGKDTLLLIKDYLWIDWIKKSC
jgi:hypothetical protein